MDWYVMVGGERKGPVAEGDLSAMVESGELTPDSAVWNEDLDDWVAARDCAPLVAILPALKPKKAPPPPPKPAAAPPPNPPGAQQPGAGFQPQPNQGFQQQPGPGFQQQPNAGFAQQQAAPAGEPHWLVKVARSLGRGWGGATPEQLNPTSAVGMFRLEIYGACTALIALSALGALWNLIAQFMMPQLQGGDMGTAIVAFVIYAVVVLLYWVGGKNALKGSYGLAKTMFIVTMVLGGLGVLLNLLALAVVPLLALISLLIVGASVYVAIIGFQRAGRLSAVGG